MLPLYYNINVNSPPSLPLWLAANPAIDTDRVIVLGVWRSLGVEGWGQTPRSAEK